MTIESFGANKSTRMLGEPWPLPLGASRTPLFSVMLSSCGDGRQSVDIISVFIKLVAVQGCFSLQYQENQQDHRLLQALGRNGKAGGVVESCGTFEVGRLAVAYDETSAGWLSILDILYASDGSTISLVPVR